ncbi:MAG: hypothetical protein RLZZ546_967, partial [Bacteroidota bacterium]
RKITHIIHICKLNDNYLYKVSELFIKFVKFKDFYSKT